MNGKSGSVAGDAHRLNNRRRPRPQLYDDGLLRHHDRPVQSHLCDGQQEDGNGEQDEGHQRVHGDDRMYGGVKETGDERCASKPGPQPEQCDSIDNCPGTPVLQRIMHPPPFHFIVTPRSHGSRAPRVPLMIISPGKAFVARQPRQKNRHGCRAMKKVRGSARGRA